MKENIAAPTLTKVMHRTLICKVFIEAIILMRLKTQNINSVSNWSQENSAVFPLVFVGFYSFFQGI